MNKSMISEFFQCYVKAFELQDSAKARTCYQLPCTLHTPDKAVLIASEDDFYREFSAIFSVLSQANIKQFKSLTASYSEIEPNLVLACIDWQFIGVDEQVFTDFSAFYHLSKSAKGWKIINVVSQELNQSICLDTPFNITT